MTCHPPRRKSRNAAKRVHTATAMLHRRLGLEPIDDGLWKNIVYYNTLLGRLSERTGRISGTSFRSDEC
jgi:hypothetical protein